MDLALLLDTSASMVDKMSIVHEAATGFVSSARPGDRVTIVDIKDGVKVLHPLDEDLDGARAAIRSTAARGGTALYNGLYMTLKEMVKLRRDNGEVRRQAMLVLSDGDDTSSLVDFDDVMEVAKQSGIAIYTITLRTDTAASAGGVTREPPRSGVISRCGAGAGNGCEGVLSWRGGGSRGRLRHDCRRTGEPVLARIHVDEHASRRRLPSRDWSGSPSRGSAPAREADTSRA